MLNGALMFLVIGLTAAVLGFIGLAGAATGNGWILFVVFMILFFVSMIMGRKRFGP